MSNIKQYITTKREPFFEIAKKYIKSNTDNVLDVGSGNGAFANFIKHENIYLFDGNPDSVKLLSSKYSNVTLGKLPILPFEDMYFDVIHCSHVIEHLYPQEFYDTLAEFDRCLKQGGYLIISTPLMWPKFYNDLSHIKPYQPFVLEKYLTKDIVDNTSRSIFSSKYKTIELVYRYYEIKPKIVINTKTLILQKIIRLLQIVWKKIGFMQIDKNGYTIVLKKNNQII